MYKYSEISRIEAVVAIPNPVRNIPKASYQTFFQSKV